MVTVKAKETVSHGRYFAHKGESIEMTEAEAKDLEAAGLVEIDKKKAPEPDNKMASQPDNKGQATKPRGKAK